MDDELSGRVLGGFVVGERLGRGGFGTVYRATQRALGREAVIKVLHRRHGAERFLREAQLASRLEHPYAAHIYDFGVEPDGVRWIAMELARGRPLDRILVEDGPLLAARLVPLLERICEVVEGAHAQGIVHRDLKPANIVVLVRAGRLLPKLLDFGIAKLIGEAEGAGEPAEPTETPLTQRGTVLGSPPYMAPEQWTDASIATAETDQYALAVIAFECLTGAAPFQGTLTQVARGHAREPFPSLGDPAIDAVLARAAAKAPSDRYPSVLHLARALRDAAGLAEDREIVPRFPAPIAQAIAEAWPQPLAECAARLQTARNVHQAHDAAVRLADALVRWLAAIALAARLQVGPGDRESPAVAELLRRARGRRPEREEWGRLVTELTRGFLATPGAHPIPALVGLTGSLTAVEAALVVAPDTGDDPTRASLTAVIGAFVAAFPRLAWIGDHRVVVDGESFSGLRRQAREHLGGEGGAVLLDPVDQPAVVLTPLVTAARPLPGAPEELFVLGVADPAGFERDDPALWEALAPLVGGNDAEAAIAEEEVAPYPGLAPFTAADRGRFFGREREVEELANRVRASSFVTVAGPSGVGKSSLVLAGVVPRFEANGVAVIRPGSTPRATLEAALASRPALIVVDQLEELVTVASAEEAAGFAERLVVCGSKVVVTCRDDLLGRVAALPRLRAPLGTSLLFLATPGVAELQRILALPARAAGYRFDDGLVADMIDAVGDDPGALPLLSFTAAELWRLRDRGFRRLLRRAYVAIGGVGGALAHHAEALLAGLSVAERDLVRDAFRALVGQGGTRVPVARTALRHVLGERGERVLEALVGARLLVASESPAGEPQLEIIHEALALAWPRLAAWRREDAEGAALRDQLREAAAQWDARGRPRGLLWRDDPLAELARWRRVDGRTLPPVEEAFAAASLDQARRTRRTRVLLVAAAFAVLAVAAGVLGWQRTVATRAETHARETLLYQYEEQGRRALLDGDVLGGAPYLLAAKQGGRDGPALRYLLGEVTRAFGAELRRFTTGGGRVYAVAFLGDVVWTGSEDGKARAFDRRTGDLVQEVADEELAPIYALAVAPDRVVVGGEPATLWTGTGKRLARLAGTADARVLGIAIHGDQILVASRDGKARLFSLADGRPGPVLEGHQGPVRRARFAADGARVVTASEDRTAAIWSSTGTLLTRLVGHADAVRDVALSPDGTEVATAGWDGALAVWGEDGSRRLQLVGRGARLEGLEWSPSGAVVLAFGDGGATAWDPRTGHRRCDLVTDATIVTARFSPDGTRVAGGTRDGDLRVWDADTCAELAIGAGHTNTLWSLAWDVDGDELVTGAFDGTARLWSFPPRRRGSPGSPLRAAFFAGEEVVTAAADGNLVIWSHPPRHLAHGGPLEYAEGQGAHLVSAGADGRVVVWGDRETRIDAGEGMVFAARFSPDGTRLVTARGGPRQTERRDRTLLAEGGELALWSLDGRRLAVAPTSAVAIAFAPDGSLITSELATDELVVRDPSTLMRRRALPTDGPAPRWIDFDGDLLYVGTSTPFVTVTSWRSGAEINRLPTSTATNFVEGHAQTSLLVTMNMADATFSIWETRSGRLLRRFAGHRAAMARFALDGQELVTADESGVAFVFPTAPEDRPAKALAPLVRCHSPYIVEGGKLASQEPGPCPP